MSATQAPGAAASATQAPGAPAAAASATQEPRLGELPPRLLALITLLVAVAFAAGLVIGLIVH